jgi:hypothetical protein
MHDIRPTQVSTVAEHDTLMPSMPFLLVCDSMVKTRRVKIWVQIQTDNIDMSKVASVYGHPCLLPLLLLPPIPYESLTSLTPYLTLPSFSVLDPELMSISVLPSLSHSFIFASPLLSSATSKTLPSRHLLNIWATPFGRYTDIGWMLRMWVVWGKPEY